MIVTPDDWKTFTGKNPTATELAQIGAICMAVDRMFKDETGRVLERGNYTAVLDSPPAPQIRLFRWAPIVIESLIVWYNTGANGDPAEFDTEDLLEPYVDYTFQADAVDPTLCSSGVITRVAVNSGTPMFWGETGYWPPYSVSAQRVPLKGALKVSLTGGFKFIPMDLKQAAVMAVTKIWRGQPFGGQFGSESWNDYSYSLPNAALGILQDPSISMTLDRYKNYGDMI